MPQPSLQRRVKQAKRRGVAPAIKATDLGEAAGRSAHAEKKQQGVVGFAQIADRNVSRRSPPGHSVSGRKRLPTRAPPIARRTRPVVADAAVRITRPSRMSVRSRG